MPMQHSGIAELPSARTVNGRVQLGDLSRCPRRGAVFSPRSGRHRPLAHRRLGSPSCPRLERQTAECNSAIYRGAARRGAVFSPRSGRHRPLAHRGLGSPSCPRLERQMAECNSAIYRGARVEVRYSRQDQGGTVPWRIAAWDRRVALGSNGKRPSATRRSQGNAAHVLHYVTPLDLA
jgi:hypothetical protein